jgi:phosphoribosylformylglycinamidine synthase
MKVHKTKPRVLILRTAGTNCDKETAFAFEVAGARAEILHINQLISANRKLSNFSILAIPGGFSYGDDIAAGKILANELKYRLEDDLLRFLEAGKLVIGICNGFQVLVKAGILPGSILREENFSLEQISTLTNNDSNKFEDRWVYLKSQVTSHKSQVRCVWTKNLPEVITLPVAHGEGKFICQSKSALQRLDRNHQVVLRYCKQNGSIKSVSYPENPNGSEDNIAGICDPTGRIFGLMPHPERHIWNSQSPYSKFPLSKIKPGDGLIIFVNGVNYAKRYL